jgi:hypothetical protein
MGISIYLLSSFVSHMCLWLKALLRNHDNSICFLLYLYGIGLIDYLPILDLCSHMRFVILLIVSIPLRAYYLSLE